MYKEFIKKHKKVGIVCNSIKDCRLVVSELRKEITFKKAGYTETDFEHYFDILNDDFKSVLIIIYRFPTFLKSNKKEFQFYVRSFEDKNVYVDWNDYKYINLTHFRKKKLKRILNEV